MIYTIYCLTSPNGKKYVGQTSQSVTERWHGGNGYKNCTALQRAIGKYGWDNFTREILAECDSPETADELERKYIAEYGTIVPNGYNLSSGGSNNHKLSEETKRKIGEANRGRKMTEEQRKRLSESKKGSTPWNKGKTGVYDDETRKRMSANMRGRTSPRKGVCLSEETKKKLSESRIGKPGPRKGAKNKPITEETRRKLSEALKGKPSKLKGKPWSEARRKAQEKKKGATK